jgi:hypothetical protein
MEVRWVAQTEGEVALAAAATAKSILNAIAATGKVLRITELGISLDATPTEPVLVELCRSTQATAGTSTAVTPRQSGGNPNATVGATAAKNYSAEPTVLTPIREWTLADKAPLVIQFPLGREPESLDGDGLVLRLTNPTGTSPSARAYIEFCEG